MGLLDRFTSTSGERTTDSDSRDSTTATESDAPANTGGSGSGSGIDTGTDTEADAEAEQLAETDGSDLDPRGEHRHRDDDRQDGGFLLSRFGTGTSGSRWSRSFSWASERDTDQEATESEDIPTDVAPPPEDLREDYRQYYLEFAFAQSALKTFDEMVVEPGWDVTATIDGETDEDMTEALETWGQNCVIHAGEPGHDLIQILSQCPSKRRAKPAVLVEKVGTRDAPDSIAALQLLDPASISIRTRQNQNLVVQPGDQVDDTHPTTDDGTPAAYVQYDDALARDFSHSPIPFASTDLLKLTYDPAEGSPWGRTIWPAISEHIDGLKRKLRDRNASIRLAGHPHRIYSSDTWSQQEAKEFSEAHQEGEVSAWDDDLDDERRSDGYASRVDFVNSEVDVQVVEGEIADISEAVRDDLEAIFSILPVNKYLIAYADDINQHVVEPQAETDDRTVDKERRDLEAGFGPLFAEKADELASGDYAGDIDFSIAQPEAENPLVREDFDADRFTTFIDAFATFAQTDADTLFPTELPYFAAGMDREQFEEDFGAAMAMEELDEDDRDVQAAADAMGIGENGAEGDGDVDADEDSE